MSRADALLDVLRRSHSLAYIGEPISQLEHALQAAAKAEAVGADIPVILAALFHDIGHLIAPQAPQMDGLGTIDHEHLGADYLVQMGCTEDLALLVRSHVQAKRYLCARNPGYHHRLSDASRGTLQFQGGPMAEDEAIRFEALPRFKDILRLRAWDEAAKDPQASVPGLDHYRSRLAAHLQHHPHSGE